MALLDDSSIHLACFIAQRISHHQYTTIVPRPVLQSSVQSRTLIEDSHSTPRVARPKSLVKDAFSFDFRNATPPRVGMQSIAFHPGVRSLISDAPSTDSHPSAKHPMLIRATIPSPVSPCHFILPTRSAHDRPPDGVSQPTIPGSSTGLSCSWPLTSISG